MLNEMDLRETRILCKVFGPPRSFDEHLARLREMVLQTDADAMEDFRLSLPDVPESNFTFWRLGRLEGAIATLLAIYEEERK